MKRLAYVELASGLTKFLFEVGQHHNPQSKDTKINNSLSRIWSFAIIA